MRVPSFSAWSMSPAYVLGRFVVSLLFLFTIWVVVVESMALPRRPLSSSSSASSSSSSSSSRNERWYDKRKNQGIKVPRRTGAKPTTNKPPQWEKEGDSLYAEIVIVRPPPHHPNGTTPTTPQLSSKITYEDAENLFSEQLLLRQLPPQQPSPSFEKNERPTRAVKDDEYYNDYDSNNNSNDDADHDDDSSTTVLNDVNQEVRAEEEVEAPFLWGGLSVGPVWKSRLVQAGLDRPTPIQVAAFDRIAREKEENLIVASPTGSGKSLAYLLPLLTTRSNNKDEERGRVWVVTPTTELAIQLQRVVSRILSEDTGDDNDDVDAVPTSPTVHILNAFLRRRKDDSSDNTVQLEEDNNNECDDSPLLSSLVHSTSFILAGTPRAYQQLMTEINKPVIADKVLRSTAKNVMKNLETLVFDEADRLFETEAFARMQQERKQQREMAKDGGTFAIKARRNATPRSLSVPLSLSLLKTIAFQSRRFFQHSYTTGRSDPTKSASKVRVICASATIGRTLRRQLMEALETPSIDKAASLVTADVRTKKDANKRKDSLLPTTLQHAYCLCHDNVDAISAMISTLIHVPSPLSPAPAILFPGRAGVKAVQTELKAAGFGHVYGLEDIVNRMTEQSSSSSLSSSSSSSPPTTAYTDWKSTPIFVVSEKLVRGLDVPYLGFVLSLQVPSSAAGYTHLAGRTGRNGQKGIAVSFCQAREAPKLVAIANTLGLTGKFQRVQMGPPPESPSRPPTDVMEESS
jgi:superfamily II DNA/RNA helicase